MRRIEIDGFLVYISDQGTVKIPTKVLYPYDAARGWQDFNMANMIYWKYKGERVMHSLLRKKRIKVKI